MNLQLLPSDERNSTITRSNPENAGLQNYQTRYVYQSWLYIFQVTT